MSIYVKRLLITSIALPLIACGGGSGGSTQQTAQAPQAPLPLEKYVGTWKSDCSSRNRTTQSFAKVGGAIEMATFKTEYYDSQDCSGPVLATVGFAGNPLSPTFTGTANASVALSAGAVATTIAVDKAQVTIPSYPTTVTGSTVTVNGNTSCIVFTKSGGSVCYGTAAKAAETTDLGLYLSGTDLYFLIPGANGTFIVQTIYRKVS